MPLFRPSPRAALAAEEKARHEALLTPEEVLGRRRRRRLWLGLGLLALLILGGALGGRPAARALKGWQARRLAAQALALLEREDWKGAQAKIQDAYALRPGEPAAIRAAALLLTRVGRPREAKPFWTQLEAARPLSRAEERDFASVELALDELDAAQGRLALALPPPGQGEGTPADWSLGLQLALRRRESARALTLARQLAASAQATERQRLEAALALLNLSAGEAAGWESLARLARSQSPEALEALVILARQASRAAAALPPGLPALEEIIALLEAHPQARIAHRLLAVDLRIGQAPERRAALIAQAIEKFGGEGASAETLAGLSAWLYAKGEFERALAVNPLSKALGSRALFLQHLDTLGALGRWGEVESLIKSQKVSLDPLLEQMYLARCAELLGQPQASALRWQGALAAAKPNADRLLALAAYAQKNGALSVAEQAARAAVAAAPEGRAGHEALLGILQAQGRTGALREAVQEMLERWPQDAGARNDAAYLDALLGEKLEAARASGRELVRANPASLPHRATLALAEWRLGHALSALDAFGGMDPLEAGTQPRHLAVYAAVLWETGYNEKARHVAALIDPKRLLPEERHLLDPLLPQ